jgi:hypothetical protein
MVNIANFNSTNSSNPLTYANFQALQGQNNEEDISIFDTSMQEDENLEFLTSELANVESEQGAIKNAWNDFKETIGIGTSVDKCDEAIEQYKNGEISFEEADETIKNFAQKQDSSLNLFSNIATSVAAIAAVAGITVLTAGVGTGAAIAIGAGTGAAIKSAFKFTDRATNEVEGDALDAKQITRDALSGAVTGGLATATMGTASGASSVQSATINCAKTGLKTGAIASSSNYAIDCAFDDNRDFNAQEFVAVTLTGSAVGGAVGGIMGFANGTLHSEGILNSGCNLENMLATEDNKVIVENAVANSGCTTSYKVLNDRIRAVAA